MYLFGSTSMYTCDIIVLGSVHFNTYDLKIVYHMFFVLYNVGSSSVGKSLFFCVQCTSKENIKKCQQCLAVYYCSKVLACIVQCFAFCFSIIL